MNGQLQPGTILVSDAHVQYKVISLLGAGGQGEVYKVESGGKFYALKWYFPQSALPQQEKILKRLIDIGKPDDTFLWPNDLIHGGKKSLAFNGFENVVSGPDRVTLHCKLPGGGDKEKEK